MKGASDEAVNFDDRCSGGGRGADGGAAVLGAGRAGRAPTDWRTTLERYLDFTAETVGGRATVVESVKADQPAKFRDTDFVTFGNARYFSPEVDLDETPLLQSTPVMPARPRRRARDVHPLPHRTSCGASHCNGRMADSNLSSPANTRICLWPNGSSIRAKLRPIHPNS
jgi:hypothetical protein